MKLNHHAPYFLDPCATLGEGVAAEIVTAASDWSCICETVPDGELGGVIAYAHPDNAEVIAVILTACHGLPIPPDVPPGALAALVDAALAVDRADTYIHERPLALASLRAALAPLALASLRAALAPLTTDPAPPVSPPVPQEIEERLNYLRGEIEAERISYGEIAELQDLAPYIDKDDTVLLEWAGVPEFPEEGELERKPYGYAVKANVKGYLAIQGNQAWFESEPVGWAIFGTEDHALAMLEENHSMIGTATHEGGKVVPVYRD